MKQQKGFTLAELVIAIVILGILATLAAPSFREVIRNNRLTSGANLFLSALSLARTEAVRRNERVMVCKSADGSSCTTDDGYEQGWLVFVDADNDAGLDSDEVLIRVQDGLPGEAKLISSSTSNGLDNYVAYVGTGRARSISNQLQNGLFSLCDGDKGRVIRINTIGRVRIEDGEDVCSG